MRVVGTATNGGELREYFKENKDAVDVALIDIGMRIEDGLTVLSEIKENYKVKTKLIAITGMRGRNYPAEAFNKHADGFIAMYHDFNKITEAIREAHQGKRVYLPDPTDPHQPEEPPPPPPSLSPIEERLLYLIACKKMKNIQAARELNLSQPNTERIRSVIMHKLKATTAVELGAAVERLGFCAEYKKRNNLKD